MTATADYQNFDITIDTVADGTYRITAESAAGSASREVGAPFSELELQNLILRAGLHRGPARRGASPAREAARELGRRLYESFLGGNVGEALTQAEAAAHGEGDGLRIRLRLEGAPEMAHYPWEFWNRPDDDQFLVLSRRTPIVRYLPGPDARPPKAIDPPLRVLLVISDPVDSTFPKLDVAAERDSIERALRPMTAAGLVELVPVEKATLNHLRDVLNEGGGHIVHFVGHGVYDHRTGEGLLEMEDGQGKSRMVAGRDLGTMLNDHDIRLVVLNSCEGARNDTADPFAGSATALVGKGIPAVIAMQFEITDEAAEALARAFYAGIVRGEPVDVALTEARLRLFGDGNDTEWATPVLYLRAETGRLFELAAGDGETANLVAASDAAAGAGDWKEAARLLSRAEVLGGNDAGLAERAADVRSKAASAEERRAILGLVDAGAMAEARTRYDRARTRHPDLDGDGSLAALVGAGSSPPPPPTPPPGPANGRSRSRIIGLSAALAVVAVVAGVFGFLAFRPPEVPSMIGATEDDARRLAAAAGVAIESVSEVHDPAAAGLVVAHDPWAGDRADSVRLVLSLGPQKTVPEVVGLAEGEALAAMAESEVAAEVRKVSDPAPEGAVIGVEPPAGTEWEPEDDPVVIVVSLGPPPPVVPPVVGQTRAAAESILANVGIAATVTERESEATLGLVVDQDPPAGASAAEVTLFVSAGPGAPVVPDVAGHPEAEARADLEELGIDVTVEPASSATVPSGTVMSQQPPAGERSQSATIVVSSGPAVDDYEGSWKNIDEATNGTTRLTVSVDESGTVTVEGFGKCTPNDCVWGATTGQFADGRVIATWDFGFKKTTVVLARSGPLVVVEQTDDYTDADGRADRESAYTMSVIPPEQLTAEELETVMDLELVPFIIGSPGGEELIPLLPTPTLAPVDP